MAPRTYLKKQVPASIPQSAMAINALLATNMVKTYHSRGQHINDSSSLLDSSLHLNKTDDTFTRIARGANYNSVKFTKNKVPYESLPRSRSTLDIHSHLAQSDRSSKIKLDSNNSSGMNDRCINNSLILIQSWEEPRHRFVTQRRPRKSKRKGYFVKAKYQNAKAKSVNASRMSSSNNESNNRKNTSGVRLSNRISVRVFEGFNSEDMRDSRVGRLNSNRSFSIVDNAPQGDVDTERGFHHLNQHSANNVKSLHDDSIRVNSRTTETQDNYVQNDSCLPSVNNSILCDNSNFFATKTTSTPITKPQAYHKHLEESVVASPIITSRHTRARSYALQHKTDNDLLPDINTTDTSRIYSKDYSSVKKTPNIQGDTINKASPIMTRGRSKSFLHDREVSSISKRNSRSQSCLEIELSISCLPSKRILRPRSCPPDRNLTCSPKREMSFQEEEEIASGFVAKRRRSRGRPPKTLTNIPEILDDKGFLFDRSRDDRLMLEQSDEETTANESSVVQPRQRGRTRGREPRLNRESSADTSMKRNSRSRGRPRKSEQPSTEEPLDKCRQTGTGETWTSFVYDESVEKGPVAMRTRSRSRSCSGRDFSSVNVSRDSERLEVSTKTRRKSVGVSRRKSCAIEKVEPNEDYKFLGTPSQRVTLRRKTVAEETPTQSVKSAKEKAATPISTNVFRRKDPIRTRLQSKLLLQLSENDSKTTPALMNNNTTEIIDLNNTTANTLEVKHKQTTAPSTNTFNNHGAAITINSSIEPSVKQETVQTNETDAEELNYSIQDVTSPRTSQNECNFNSDFVPMGHCTPRLQRRRSSTDKGDDEDELPFIKQSPVSIVPTECEDVQSECLYINDVKQEHQFMVPSIVPMQRKVYCPGKKYRRSIFSMRKDAVVSDDYVQAVNSSRSTIYEKRRSSVRLVPVTLQQNVSGTNNVETDYPDSPKRLLQRRSSVFVGSNSVEQSVRSVERSESLLDESVDEEVAQKTARTIVLRNCDQDKPEPWETYYPDSVLVNCSKIGEGVYGEVFMFRNAKRSTSVMKVIPIEGDQIVNGEPQKKFQDVLSEIIIAKKLSSLPTSGFNRLEAVHLVCGAYPERLLDHWHVYNEAKGSENDCPDIFQTDNQLYLVLQLEHGGKDLESYGFKNSVEAYSIFVQLVHSLAQAEEHFAFEHRDLHWGNVLISDCAIATTLAYTLDDTHYAVNTHGVQCNIIDFTLSRMTVPLGEDVVDRKRLTRGRKSVTEPEGDWVLYNDLKEDLALFEGEGDVQFDVYRQMRTENGDDWKQFCPKTNVLWLNYILQKMLTEIEYSHPKSRAHKSYLSKMRRCRSRILTFSSCADVVKSLS